MSTDGTFYIEKAEKMIGGLTLDNLKLKAQLEAATTTLKAIATDPETYEGILANKCLAELKRLEDE